MKTPCSRSRQVTPLGVAMTPMIDVVFLLLVFFLCTATFHRPESELAASVLAENSRAGEGGVSDTIPAPLEDVLLSGVKIDGEAVWSVNERPGVSHIDELIDLLAEIAEVTTELPVTIDAVTGVTLRDVVTAYDAARAAGFVEVRIAADADTIRGATP